MSSAPIEHDDAPAGPEISIGPSVILLILVWPLMQVAASDGVLLPALIGLGGGLAVAAVSAFSAGLFEGMVGPKRAASTAFAASSAAAAIYWWRALPWWAAAILSALAVVGWASLFRREQALEGVVPRRVALPERVQLELDALPPLDGALAASRDRLLSAYTQVSKAAIELGDDDLIDGRTLRADAEGTAVAALRQLRRLGDMGDDADTALAELRAEGQARLDRLVDSLAETRTRLLAFLQVRDEGRTPTLEAHAEQLRHAATGLREVDEVD